MKFQTTSKLELNVTKSAVNPHIIADFAIKNRIPAILAPSELVGAFVTHRGMRNGQYRVICLVDFPKGKKFALDKLKGVHEDFSLADGYEVLLSQDKSEVELKNEMKAIRGFLKQVNSTIELRWCLGALSRDESNTKAILKEMRRFPAAFVRVDQHLKFPNINIDDYLKACSLISESVPFPMKISGNVDLNLIKTLLDQNNFNIKRFDVDFDMATSIVRELENEERKQLEQANLG